MTRGNVLITGANTGIGRATAETLAAQGHSLWLANRSEEKTTPVVAALRAAAPQSRVQFLPLDLADLASVRTCAERFLALGEPLHVLVANAGLGGQRGQTKQGFELAFGTNHLGHFLLTQLLLPALEKGAPSRVVVVSSSAHYRAKLVDWSSLRVSTRSFTGIPEYRFSKLCNVLFARRLAERVRDARISTYSLHPGVVSTDIWRRVPRIFQPLLRRRMISSEEGAQTSIYCATAPELEGKTGLYWQKCRERAASSFALDDALAQSLWEKSEEFTRA
jgi:NAD(P)-dependent dehydrogenase (short-subunit alcohol dehydrogenase family)